MSAAANAASGDYSFVCLIVCLLTLALQIYSPFGGQRICQCDCRSSLPSPGVDLPTPSSFESRKHETKSGGVPPPPPPPPRHESGSSSSMDLLKELSEIQDAARVHHSELERSGRLPPETPISRMASEAADEYRRQDYDMRKYREGPGYDKGHEYTPPTNSNGFSRQPNIAVPAPSELGIRTKEDFSHLLQAQYRGTLGVILGVGRGDLALHLLRTWEGSLYLVDPYIHIWQGYDDPSNLSDKEHQLIFEELRNRLVPYEGRHLIVRDFSFSFATTYKQDTSQPPPAFVFVDGNHAYEAVRRDVELWWDILGKGGIMAGSTFVDSESSNIGVKRAVEEFSSAQHVTLFVTPAERPPTWFMVKA